MNIELFDNLWGKHKPSQGYHEFRWFLEFIEDKLPDNPVVIEIGVRRGNQRYFYKQLLNADYKGIDIKKPIDSDFICGNSGSRRVYNEIKEWLNGRKIDLLFIDGDHSYEGVKTDYELYAPLANITAMHDINTNNKRHIGVKKFWEGLKKKRAVEFKCINKDQNPTYWADGIGVIL